MHDSDIFQLKIGIPDKDNFFATLCEASLHLADSKYSELDLGQQNWEEVRKITNYQTETGSWPHVVAENKEYKIKLL